jgi:hypothetical protein
MTVGKRLAILALLGLGGCEFLAKHVRVESTEHSPFAETWPNSVGPDRSGGRMEIEMALPLGKND